MHPIDQFFMYEVVVMECSVAFNEGNYGKAMLFSNICLFLQSKIRKEMPCGYSLHYFVRLWFW